MTTGTVVGREHRRRGRGGQDAAAVALAHGVACAVVCDGCSSGEASEVGARLSARWIAAHAPRIRREIDDDQALGEAVFSGLCAHLGRVADDLGGDLVDERAPIVAEMLLATALVALVDLERGGRTVVFGIGDGVVLVDGEVRVLGDGTSAPAYPAYRLLGAAELDARDRAWLAPRVHYSTPSAERFVLALATDGATELEAQRGTTLRDGSAIEGLAALATDARLRANPSLLGKRLFALGEVHGRLSDDTTIAVIELREEA
jgi:hypothetical protein